MHLERSWCRQWSCQSRLLFTLAPSCHTRRQWAREVVLAVVMLFVMAMALVAISLWTDWDLLLADRAFDTRANAFPLRHAWLTATFNHVILKRCFTVLALAIVGAVLWDLCAPRSWPWLLRFQLRVIALSAVLVPTAISLLKQVSHSHCPWDLQRYGGSAPYVGLFERVPPGLDAGHCMPAGHASSALWMISLCVLFLPYRLLHAGLALAVFLTLGIAVGWLQQLRGAHFLTHTLWSAWIAMAIVLLILLCLDRWPTRSVHCRKNATNDCHVDRGRG